MKNKVLGVMLKVLVMIAIIAIAIFASFVYSNAKEDDKSKTDKIAEEIKFLDSSIISLINKLNGIQLENYKITVSKVQEGSAEDQSGSSKTDANSGEEKGEEESGEKEEEEGTSGKESTISKMEQELIAVDDKETDWNWIQAKTEILYSVWATIVLDLYDIDIDSSKIVDFSNTLDDTLISIKDNDKKLTSQNLAKLYTFLPEFMKNTEIEDIKKNIIDIKSNILRAYAYVESENWEKVQIEIVDGEKKMAQIMNDLSKKEDQRKYNINKTYILIEELKNSLSTKDKGIFYLKYKNLIEGINFI